MKWFNDSKITLLLLAFVVALMVTAGSANADFTFGKPVNVGSAIPFLSGLSDSIDCLSYDGLEMYIESMREGGQGGWDLWVLKRASIDEPWGSPVNLGPAVNSPNFELLASISADGLTLYFCSDRPYGDDDRYDLFVTTRATKNDPWGQAVNMGPSINVSATDWSPWISPDGLDLYFASNRPGGYGRSDIYLARRATPNDPWGEPVNLGPAVNSTYSETYLSLSPDGLLLLFSNSIVSPFPPHGYGSADMWITRRASISDPWQAAVNLGPKVNGPGLECQPRISPDGRTLYFFVQRDGPYYNFQAPIIPIVDFNADGIVNLKDFSKLAQYWGQDEPSVDIGPMAWGDGRVDMRDLSVLAESWAKDMNAPRLLAHWKLDEAEGFIAHDSAGKKSGTLNGNPSWEPTGGQIDGALQFDGIDDHVSTPFILNPAGGAFSVFAWIKGGGPGQVIISQTDGTGWGSIWLGTDSTNGKLMTTLMFFVIPLQSECVITDAAWHRVGVVWDGLRRHLYADGQEVAKDAADFSAGISCDGGLHIGATKGLEPGSFWSGLIDDVQIYDRAVTP